MTIIKEMKWDIFKIFLIISTLFLIGVSIITIYHSHLLKIEEEGFSKIEYIGTEIQRLAKLELEHNPNNEIIKFLDMIASHLTPDNMSHEYFNKTEQFYKIALEIAEEWLVFREAIMDFRDNEERDILFLASESNYYHFIQTTKVLELYIEDLTILIFQLKKLLMFNLLVIAGLLFQILSSATNELKRSTDFSNNMFIDLSTGVYNRTKCQELLNQVVIDTVKERSVIIFNLQSSQAIQTRKGQRIISEFSDQLKEATKIFSTEVFIGRCGMNEFMAYFDSIDEKELDLYLNEVNYLICECNRKTSKSSQIVYTVGCSITNTDTKSLTLKELFNIADTNMRQNNKIIQ